MLAIKLIFLIFISQTNKKSTDWKSKWAFQNYEVSMNQNHIKSQTTPQGTLYQSPTSTNTVKYKSKSGVV